MTLKTADTLKIAKPDGPWLPISGAFTRLTYLFSKRYDLTVSIAPGAGWGSPAAMLPPAASVEINGDFWPAEFDPAMADPSDHEDWKNYPAVMGLLIHELSHGDHSDWMYQVKKRVNSKFNKLTDDEMHALGAATILEEARIEHQHIKNRPQDTPWLQASATTIALAEALNNKELPSKTAASRVAAIILARADGGSLMPGPELDKVRTEVEAVLTFPLLKKLRDIWREFLDADDYDTPRLMDLGKEWYELTKDDGDQDSGGEGGDGGESSGGSGIPKALEDALNALGEAVMGDASGSEELAKILKRLAEADAKRKSESGQKEEAKRKADRIFHGQQGGAPTGLYQPLRGFRPPTTQERILARRTSKGILKAYVRESAYTKTTSKVPPGRFKASVAIQGDAQAAQGMYPTVEPFTRKEYQRTSSPPLKVGILGDTSDSQDGPVKYTASGAWSLASAVRAIPDGSVAMAIFGDKARKVFGPWEKPKQVPNLRAGGGTGFFKDALRALEGELNLMRGGAARLLVIVTDGMLNPSEYAGRDELLKRYLNASVHILWVVTGSVGYFDLMSKVGLNGKWGYGGDAPWYIPEIVHPNFRVARPYTDAAAISKMICDEAVKTLESTK